MSNINIDDCSICWNVLVNDTVKLPCNHVYHITCIESWTKYNNTCPYCRYNFKINNNLNNNRVPLINDYADELIIPDGDIDNLTIDNYLYFYYLNENTFTNEYIQLNIEKIKLAKQLKSSLSILSCYKITGLGKTYIGKLIGIGQIGYYGTFSCKINISNTNYLQYFDSNQCQFELI